MSPVEMLFSLSVLGQGSGFKSGGCFWVQGEWCTLDSPLPRGLLHRDF